MTTNTDTEFGTFRIQSQQILNLIIFTFNISITFPVKFLAFNTLERRCSLYWYYGRNKYLPCGYGKDIIKLHYSTESILTEYYSRRCRHQTYRAPRATNPSTLMGSICSALFKHWKASDSWPALKNLMPSATLFNAHLPFCILRKPSALSFSPIETLQNIWIKSNDWNMVTNKCALLQAFQEGARIAWLNVQTQCFTHVLNHTRI